MAYAGDSQEIGTDKILVVCEMVKVAVAGAALHGSRQAVVAAAIAAVRTSWCLLFLVEAAADLVDDAAFEVRARLGAFKPVLVEYVLAAKSSRPPVVSGLTWLRRNVAAHTAFGEGAAALYGSVVDLKRRQNGRRCPGSQAETGQTEPAAEPAADDDAFQDVPALQARAAIEEVQTKLELVVAELAQAKIDLADAITARQEVAQHLAASHGQPQTPRSWQRSSTSTRAAAAWVYELATVKRELASAVTDRMAWHVYAEQSDIALAAVRRKLSDAQAA